jgi:hypothetical protein
MIPELNSITSLFTEKQKHIAESTGFKLFAKPLHPLLFDKQFQVWLMPKVDTMARTIAANGGRRLMIFHEDVSAVFGTPSSEKEVWDASLDKSQAMRERIAPDLNKRLPSMSVLPRRHPSLPWLFTLSLVFLNLVCLKSAPELTKNNGYVSPFNSCCVSNSILRFTELVIYF